MRNRHWLLLILLAGAALRLLLHDVHGLEGDDAFSLAISHTPTPELVGGLMRLQLDVHPPLHFLALKAWTAAAGESLLSLRVMNSLLDVLTGALLARLMMAANGGLASSKPLLVLVLWAAAPLLIFAGWLVRMYTLLGFFVTLAALCAVSAGGARRGFWWWAVGAAAASLAAMYTHILGVIVLAAVSIPLLVSAWRRSWRVLMGVAVMLGGAGVLYLPFAVNALRLAQNVDTLGAEVNPAFDSALPLLPRVGLTVWAAFVHRLPAPDGVLPLMGVIFAAALVAALVVRQRDVNGRVLLAIALLTFIGLGAMVWGIGFKPRYAAAFAPLWIAAIVIAAGRGRYGVVGTLLLLMLAGLVQDTRHGWRDDWTAAADFIETYTAPDDAVLVVPDWGQEAMRYHYDGGAPVRGFFPQIRAGLDLDAAFGEYVRDYRRVWLVRYQPEVSDPDGLARAWLESRGATATLAFPAGMQIALFDMQPVGDALPPGARPLDVRFGGALALRGVTLPDGLTTPAVNPRLYDGSGRALVALHWEPLQPNLTAAPRVRLTDTFGQVYGGALDHPNRVEARYPVGAWQPGEIITAYYDLNLNPETPPGVYNVEVMVLDDMGAPLDAVGADAGEFWAVAGQVIVQ